VYLLQLEMFISFSINRINLIRRGHFPYTPAYHTIKTFSFSNALDSHQRQFSLEFKLVGDLQRVTLGTLLKLW